MNFNPEFIKNVVMFGIAGYLYNGSRWCLIGILSYLVFVTIWNKIIEWRDSRQQRRFY
jgi:hypothetical protein